jgi:hypothetical protein
LAHITALTPDGLLVLNPMADAQSQDDAATYPDVAQALQESGLPKPTRGQYEVTRFVLAPAATDATTG